MSNNEYLKLHEEHAVTPLTISPNHQAWASEILVSLLAGDKEVGKDTFCIHKDKGLEFFPYFYAWEKASEKLLEEIKKNPKLPKKVFSESIRLYKEIFKTVRYFNKQNINSWTNKKIADYLFKTYKLGVDITAYGFIPVLSDIYFHNLTHSLKSIVKKATLNTDVTTPVPEIIHLLSSPAYFIPSKLARIDLLRLVININGKKVSKSKLKQYYTNWYWVDFGQLGPKPEFKTVVDSANELLKNKSTSEKELKEILAYPKNLQAKQLAIIKKIKLAKEEKYLFQVARDFMYLKGARMEVLFGVYASWYEILEVLAKKWRVEKNLLYYCSVFELVDWLNKNRKMSLAVLRARSKYCVWIAKTWKKSIIYTGEKAKKFLGQIKLKKEENLKEVLNIHGTVASVGYAKGTVKIVNKTSEINKVEDGDILVSVATHPALLPAMKRAAAFVTDAGGITSHAAIVARELKKPCIIGTKIATKVLRDGDLVELDTKKGDIRKI